MLDTPNRLALRRQPDKSFTLLGTVTAESKTEVTVTTPRGGVETFPRRGVVFVTIGSLNHFARLDPESLRRALDGTPRAVFEQALVDATVPLSVTELKRKLTQAGLAGTDVDRAWGDARKALEADPDVKVIGERAARKFSWTGEQETRLRAYLAEGFVEPSDDPSAEASTPESESADAQASGVSVEVTELFSPAPASDAHEPDENREVSGHPAHPTVEAPTPADSEREQHDDRGILLTTLKKVLGPAAPRSLDEVASSVLRIGSEISNAPVRELRALVDVPADQRPLVSLLLAARDREIRLWPEDPGTLPPPVAGAAIEAAIGEATRTETAQGLARFATRIIQRTSLADIPLPLVANAFVRSVNAERTSEPSQAALALAGALAARTKTSVRQEWDEADWIVREIARGMNRLPLDKDGPRSRFLAALFDIRRKHLDSDLLWRNVDLESLSQAAGGVMSRALQDPDLEERIIKPEVERFVGGCSTRQGLGKLVALRWSFAKFVDARDVTAVMGRVARDDSIASEWFRGLQQQDRVDSAVRERNAAVRAAAGARSAAEKAARRAEKAIAERDEANEALNRASQANVRASDAQLRQAKLDVLRSLASLANTIKDSAAAVDDPALLQRLGFALRREGLNEIAAPGETVTYDPALHDAQGEHIEPGTSVYVGRSGYTYYSGDESLVLTKAKVSAI